MPHALLVLSALLTADLEERVDALAEQVIHSGAVVGMSVGVVTPDRTFTRGYGRLAADRDETPDANTIYEIGSISKVFTALLLADASLRGELSLEDPVASLVPEGRAVNDLDEDDPMRLWHLATHTSGLPRMPANFAPRDPRNPYADYTFEQLFDALETVRVADSPGEAYAYSNFGAGLLGVLVARAAAADSYEELLVERVCRPLDLRDTRITVGEHDMARFAGPHDPDGLPAARWDIPALAGAGAIRSTVEDLLRFGRAQLAPPASRLGRAIEATHELRFPFESGGGMALGWHVSKAGVLWHNGQTGGYHSFLAVDPAHGFVVCVLANTATGVVTKLGDAIVVMLRGGEPGDLGVRVPVPLDPEQLERYTGEYRMNPLAKFTIERDGKHLLARLTGQKAYRIYPLSRTEFFYRVVDASITFELDGEGNPTALVLHQNGADMHCERIDRAP